MWTARLRYMKTWEKNVMFVQGSCCCKNTNNLVFDKIKKWKLTFSISIPGGITFLIATLIHIDDLFQKLLENEEEFFLRFTKTSWKLQVDSQIIRIMSRSPVSVWSQTSFYSMNIFISGPQSSSSTLCLVFLMFTSKIGEM